MHSFHKRILSIFILFGMPLVSFGQTIDTVKTVDTIKVKESYEDVFFEKIMLDGNVSFRNESTGEIISQSP